MSASGDNSSKQSLEQQIRELLCKKMIYHLTNVAEASNSDSQAALAVVNTLAATYATLFGIHTFPTQPISISFSSSAAVEEAENLEQEVADQIDGPLGDYNGLSSEETIRLIEQKKLAGVELDAGEEDIYRILKEYSQEAG